MSFEDIQLACGTCSSEFTFTADEQEFYQSKGFQEPKKCKPCRDEAKRNRGGGGGGRGGYGGGGGGRGGYGGGGGDRPQFEAICAACNQTTWVPFQPNGSKPVYCRSCYQDQKYANTY